MLNASRTIAANLCRIELGEKMSIPNEIHATLSRINTALLQCKEESIPSLLVDVDIAQLLSQETLQLARAKKKIPLTIFLATLAVCNEVSANRAQLWLDAYQSIARKELTPGILQLGRQNIFRLALESLINTTPITSETLSASKHIGSQLPDAFELLLDMHKWESALVILSNLKQTKAERFIWHQLVKIISSRMEIYINKTGKTKHDVDYEKLSNIIEILSIATNKYGAKDSVEPLQFLKASCLEIGGKHQQAIEIFKSQACGHKQSSRMIDVARCFCKSGDLESAISELDQAIEYIVSNTTSHGNLKDNTILDISSEDKTGHFNTQNASLALKDLVSICKSRSIKPFLVSGTLLGYAREGKLLAHDKDIDVGIIGWEKQYELCLALQESGLFSIDPSFLLGNKSYYIPICHNATGMWIDVFVYHAIDKKLVTGVDFFFGYRQTFAFTPFDLKEVNFLDAPMYVPENFDLNLQENFGNWRVPDVSYLSHLESPSTTDKGGISQMLTARIHTIASLNKKNTSKLAKVISILDEYSHSPWAMPPDLLAQLKVACHRLKTTAESFTTSEAVEEALHA